MGEVCRKISSSLLWGDANFSYLLKSCCDKADLGSDVWRRGFWYRLLGAATLYRQAVLGCQGCGDCIQDHLCYVGCTMKWCHKGLRNRPCGGSRTDGSCEMHPARPCVWNRIYLGTLGAHEDPSEFARDLIPPRDWRLDGTNALANRLAGLDNFPRRQRF